MDAKLSMAFELFLLYQLKHYGADFLLQTQYMLNKTLPGWGFVKPLALHCGVHALGTFWIVLFYAPEKFGLCAFDFGVHFIVDRLKSGPRYLGRFKDPSQSRFWYVLGLDQMLHHVTHICIIYWILIP